MKVFLSKTQDKETRICIKGEEQWESTMKIALKRKTDEWLICDYHHFLLDLQLLALQNVRFCARWGSHLWSTSSSTKVSIGEVILLQLYFFICIFYNLFYYILYIDLCVTAICVYILITISSFFPRN